MFLMCIIVNFNERVLQNVVNCCDKNLFFQLTSKCPFLTFHCDYPILLAVSIGKKY